MLTKILFQLEIEIIVLLYAGKSSFFFFINYWEEFVFVRRSATEKFLFVVGGSVISTWGVLFFLDRTFFFFQ